jgi:hypothetical protein
VVFLSNNLISRIINNKNEKNHNFNTKNGSTPMPLTVTLCKDAFLFSFLFNFSVTFSQKNTSSFEYRQLLRLNIGGQKK